MEVPSSYRCSISGGDGDGVVEVSSCRCSGSGGDGDGVVEVPLVQYSKGVMPGKTRAVAQLEESKAAADS